MICEYCLSYVIQSDYTAVHVPVTGVDNSRPTFCVIYKMSHSFGKKFYRLPAQANVYILFIDMKILKSAPQDCANDDSPVQAIV